MPKRRTNQKPRSNEYRIKRIIMQGYDKTTRPVSNDKSSLDVQVSISLYHILDTVSNMPLYFIPVTRHLSGKNPVAVISLRPVRNNILFHHIIETVIDGRVSNNASLCLTEISVACHTGARCALRNACSQLVTASFCTCRLHSPCLTIVIYVYAFSITEHQNKLLLSCCKILHQVRRSVWGPSPLSSDSKRAGGWTLNVVVFCKTQSYSSFLFLYLLLYF